MLGVIAVGFLLLWYRKIWWRYAVDRITQMLITGSVFSTIFVILYAHKSPIAQKMMDQGYLFLSTIGDTPNLESKSYTKEHRLSMWEQVITETIQEDPWFGQGFRDQLIEETFRNPHNSFVTIFGRMGLTGLSLAIILYICLPLLVAVRLKNSRSDCSKADLLFYLCFVVSFLSAAFFCPTLESPIVRWCVISFMVRSFAVQNQVVVLQIPIQCIMLVMKILLVNNNCAKISGETEDIKYAD